MRRAARAHVVLGVDFEKPKLWARFDDRLEMLGLETNADARQVGDPRIAKVGDRHPQLLSGLALPGQRYHLRRCATACYIGSAPSFAPRAEIFPWTCNGIGNETKPV